MLRLVHLIGEAVGVAWSKRDMEMQVRRDVFGDDESELAATSVLLPIARSHDIPVGIIEGGANDPDLGAEGEGSVGVECEAPVASAVSDPLSKRMSSASRLLTVMDEPWVEGAKRGASREVTGGVHSVSDQVESDRKVRSAAAIDPSSTWAYSLLR